MRERLDGARLRTGTPKFCRLIFAVYGKTGHVISSDEMLSTIRYVCELCAHVIGFRRDVIDCVFGCDRQTSGAQLCWRCAMAQHSDSCCHHQYCHCGSATVTTATGYD